jgi:hypothetical protein
VKFTHRLDPGSLDLANLRVTLRLGGCPHCQCIDTLVGHGFLWGLAPAGSDRATRGLRMWCSDRGSAHGCGRTLSVHWEDCIARATLRVYQLLALLRAWAGGLTRHAAWHGSRLSISLTGAYRWFARWRRGGARLVTWLKMRVLGALEYAEGSTMLARYQAVSRMSFQDEDGQPCQFTWRTIQTWCYLICFIDDASRVVTHGAFYEADDTHTLLDCFQTALAKRGIPKAVYADNP